MTSTTTTRPLYDWSACLVAMIVGLAVAIPAGLLVTRVVGSSMFLVVVVTLVGSLSHQ
jgi:hypothetical protein